MSFRTFFLGLSASFGVAWLAIIIIPFIKMRSLEPIAMDEAEGTNAVYIPKRAGRIADGAQVYAENGCYLCHTQLVRPTYAGNDMFRPDWGGLVNDEDRGDTRRETNAFDFAGEKFAQIGVSRMGPDLSNLGRRVEALYAPADEMESEMWLYRHLYNPRWKPRHRSSSCPSFRFLFKETEIKGIASDESLPFEGEDGGEISPKPDARALVSYLLSLKKDQTVPASLDFSPEAEEESIPAKAPSAAPAEEKTEEADTSEDAASEEAAPASEDASAS
ncbi:MAG: cbb3-type cytochrome c oxidase subunit II [Verrucomicrobia bacterium]|jgi:cytochrome c oxidase cbb3-type subunit 2|nr:cbb3-type cytochrome c oxidase subunit II [Verrucomicrobiota bacterium]|tara:strand:- start:15838 stop:16662 length:825 start_codon:yes stop_codon:yes gene_type:complete